MATERWNWCGWPLASLHHVRWTVTGLVGGNELGEFHLQRSARLCCPYDLLLDTTSSDQRSLRLRMFATRGPQGHVVALATVHAVESSRMAVDRPDAGSSQGQNDECGAATACTVHAYGYTKTGISPCDGDYALQERLADVTTEGRATTPHRPIDSLAPGALGPCGCPGGCSHVWCKVSAMARMHGCNAHAVSI
jgi:hypothetical protein